MKRFWYALSAFAGYMAHLRSDEAKADGHAHHTDPPCALCERMKPWADRERAWWRRGAGLAP